MKKIYLLSLIVLIGITLISCDIVPKSSPQVTTGKIVVNGISESGSRGSLADNQGSIDKLWIRAFKSLTGELIPAVGVTGTDGAAVLTWNSLLENALGEIEGGYSGSITLNLEGYTGAFYVHAMAFDANGEIVFQGNSTAITEFGETALTITTGAGYFVGDRGSGGGWIFYKKDSFDNDGTMGKDWRYLEAAAEDFSLAWISATDNSDPLVNDRAKINTGTHKIANGKVKKDDETEEVDIDEYDWNWGPAGDYSTSIDETDGWINTEILAADAITSATPKVKTAPGRKVHTYAGSEPPNTRRDLSKNLRNTAINGYSDWFVPSKAELLRIFSYLVSGSTIERNFANTKYWSSSEIAGSYNAWAIDFEQDAYETELPQDRSAVSHVRPVRAF